MGKQSYMEYLLERLQEGSTQRSIITVLGLAGVVFTPDQLGAMQQVVQLISGGVAVLTQLFVAFKRNQELG
jgi:hypothetical protein